MNGLELKPHRVGAMISEWLEIFTSLHDERQIFAFWRELVSRANVQGKHAHDARLVAAMMRHGVDAILTFNVMDSRGFPGITCFAPAEVASGRLR